MRPNTRKDDEYDEEEVFAEGFKKITQREKEIILYAAKGMTNHEIAKEMGITYKTVRTYLESVYNKTRCRTRKKLLEGWERYNKGDTNEKEKDLSI